MYACLAGEAWMFTCFTQCGTNIFFFGTNEYPNIFVTLDIDEWISEYIRHDKNITNEYPNKFANDKINEYFGEWIYSSKIFECL